MRVVHIQTSAQGAGGAGSAVLRLHRALLQEGIDSKIVTRSSDGTTPYVYLIKECSLNKYIPPRKRIVRIIKNKLRAMGYCNLQAEVWNKALWSLEEKHPDICFTTCYSSYDLANDPHVLAADIIHLHWVQNFLDFESFFLKMRMLNKPIVWTIHDINPMMGGFHHFRKREQYYSEYKELEDAMYRIKREVIVPYKNLNLVALSSQMKSYIMNHEFFQGKPVHTVMNLIDEKEFRMVDKLAAREVIGLPKEGSVLLFVSSTLNDTEKGFAECIKALDKESFKDMILVCVGDGIVPETEFLTIRQFSHINGTIWLSIIYSAADLYINCSFQESFGNTTVEAMLCGIPVVMTPVGVAKDIISDENGMICDDCTPDAISKAVSVVLSREYDSNRIRQIAVSKVNPSKIAQDYITIYNGLIKAMA